MNGESSWFMKTRPMSVDDRDLVAAIGVMDEPAATGRLVGVVDRPQDGAIGVEVLVDLALVPDVVAARDHVDAAAQQLLGEARGEAHAGRDVLAVRDHEIDVPLMRAAPAGLPPRPAGPACR